MANTTTVQARPRNRLVGQPLLYAISIFASLGVFLVSLFCVQ